MQAWRAQGLACLLWRRVSQCRAYQRAMATAAGSSGAQRAGQRHVVMFDFDRSLADADCDEHTMRTLLPELVAESRAQYTAGVSWPQVMDRALGRLQDSFSIEQIREAAISLPMHSDMLEAVKNMAAEDAALYIISDANSYYIRQILEHHQVVHHFSEIHTNPASQDEETGRWRISPCMKGHSCERCKRNPNICKGEITRSIVAKHPGARFFYIGDGFNDFCASAQLSDRDYVFARKDHRLESLLLANTGEVKARWRSWADYTTLRRWLEELICERGESEGGQ